MRRRSRLLLAAGLAVALAACQTALDLERARGFFEREERPQVPALSEVETPTLPAPEGLRATAGELRQVPLRWDPVLDGAVAGYVVERAPTEQGPFQRIALLPGRFRTSWVDVGADLAAKPDRPDSSGGLGDGARFVYRVRAFDEQGRLASPPSAAIQVATAPPPDPPEALQVYSHLPRRVALVWTPSPDPTTAGYVVLRSPTPSGDYLPVERLEGRYRTHFEDRGLGDLRVFYYRVASVNGAGGQGPPTEYERAVTKPVPLPPAGVSLRAREVGRNILGWRPNVEADLAGYRLLRRRPDTDAFETVTELPAHVTEAEDRGVDTGERVAYALVAFDRDGLESAPSDPLEIESRSWNLRARVEDGDVHLHWDSAAQAPFEVTRVLLEGFRTREVARVASDRFVDRDPPPGRRRYRIVGVRPDGTPSPASQQVEVEVPEPDAG